jgi:hypothetical protein
MAEFAEKIGRKTIWWTNHALDRWWERCNANETSGRRAAMELLREKVQDRRLERDLPPWSRVTLFHRARAEGFLPLDEDSGFIVNKNPNGDLVAVTYIENERVAA